MSENEKKSSLVPDSSQKKFSLLRLPHLPFRKCLGMMEPIEIIEFSWCSRKTKKLVRLCNFKPSYFEVSFYRTWVFICFKFDEYPGYNWMYTVEKRDFKLQEAEKVEERKLEGEMYYTIKRVTLVGPYVDYDSFVFFDPVNPYELVHHSKEYETKKLIEHFAYIFKGPITKFIMNRNTNAREIVEWFFSDIRPSVEIFQFRVCSYEKDENAPFGSIYLSQEDVRLISNTFKATDTLYLDTFIEYKFRNSTMFHSETVFIVGANWISIRNIDDMSNCKAIILFDSKFSNRKLNSIIKKWINGDFPNLELIDFSNENIRFHQKTKNKAKEILRGINFIHDPEVRRYFENESKFCCGERILFKKEMIMGGWDIQNVYGMKATVLIDFDLDYDKIRFNIFVHTKDSSITTV